MRPRQTDLIPEKGSSARVSHHPLSYCCPATIFRDILAALFGRLRAIKGQSPHHGCGLITSIRKPAARAIATIAGRRRPGAVPPAHPSEHQSRAAPVQVRQSRCWSDSNRPGVAHGQEGLPVPSTSMRVPPTEPGSPDSFLVMIAMVGLRKQLLQIWDMAL